MTLDQKPKSDVVLVLAPEGERRDELAKALRKEDFKPTFTSGLDNIMELLASLKPAALLHDWPTVDPSQAVGFHHRLGKNPSYVETCRVLYIPTLTQHAAALAADTGIRRVIPHSTTPSAMAVEIRMALMSLSSAPQMQVMVMEIAAGRKYDQGEIDASVEKAYKLYPHEPGVRIEFGLLCLRGRRIQAAQNIAEALVVENPMNVRAMNLLARALLADRKADAAAELLERANMLSPLSPERLVLLGDAFFTAGKNAKAATYYAQAMALDPGAQDASAGLARVKLSEGDVNAALDIIKNSLSEEEAASLFNNAAVRAAQTGQVEMSLKLYETALRALKSKGLKAMVQFNIALAYERLGREEEAKRALTACLKLDPEFDKARRRQQKLLQRKAS